MSTCKSQCAIAEPDQLGVVTGCVPRTQARLEGERSTRVSWTEVRGTPPRKIEDFVGVEGAGRHV